MELKPGYKQTEVGVIPEDWDVQPLEKLSSKIMVGIASAATHAYRSSGVPMFRNQNIKEGWLDDSDLRFLDSGFDELFRGKRLLGGDLLTARTGYPGTTAVVPSEYSGAQSFTSLITRPDASIVDSDYLCLYINSPTGKAFFEQSQIGGAQKNVNANSLKKMPVAFPKAKEEQESIADAVATVDTFISSLENLISKKRAIKQAAMQELLTGKRRLPGFEGEWVAGKLGDYVEKIIGGGTPSRANPEFWGAEIPWATVKDLTHFQSNQTQEWITRDGLESSSANLIPAGTLVVSTRMALGRAVIFETDVAINQDLKAIFFSKDASARFFRCWFEINASAIDAIGGGSTVKGISLSQLKALDATIPDLVEQDAVVDLISDMETEIEALENRLTKARSLKQAMMQELLTGRIRLA